MVPKERLAEVISHQLILYCIAVAGLYLLVLSVIVGCVAGVFGLSLSGL